jgi:hypothetical protein
MRWRYGGLYLPCLSTFSKNKKAPPAKPAGL